MTHIWWTMNKHPDLGPKLKNFNMYLFYKFYKLRQILHFPAKMDIFLALLIDDCKEAIDWKDVNSTIKAIDIKRTFFHIFLFNIDSLKSAIHFFCWCWESLKQNSDFFSREYLRVYQNRVYWMIEYFFIYIYNVLKYILKFLLLQIRIIILDILTGYQKWPQD